jgi:hypothetical protein
VGAALSNAQDALELGALQIDPAQRKLGRHAAERLAEGQHVEQSGFASARGPHQREHLKRPREPRHALQQLHGRQHVAVAAHLAARVVVILVLDGQVDGVHNVAPRQRFGLQGEREGQAVRVATAGRTSVACWA